MSGSSSALWSGRFSATSAEEARALGRSLDFDRRMVQQDVLAGCAHVHALRAAGLVTDDESDTLVAALRDVGGRIADGTFRAIDADEDVHSAVERGVTEALGDLGARLHAGRSRNDLVVTDLRLWLLAARSRIDAALVASVAALVARAREQSATVMPGTTHSRLAQPVTLGHHLLAHAWALLRDRERFAGWADRASTSSLGAGALATSTLALDPTAVALELGMERAFANSIDAVSDRDFVQEFLATATICATHLSRLAADVAHWSDPALGWADLDEAFATGSSMMPQKQNPDTVELVRAKAARVAADLAAVTSSLQGLPVGYHRDLQEDKEPAFDAADTLELVVPAMTGVVRTLRFHPEVMREACDDDGLYATDLAEALVKAGVPFREAHRRTGELIRELAEDGGRLADLPADAWQRFGVPDGSRQLDPVVSVEARSMRGGPSASSVREQADAVERRLAATHRNPTAG